jgi:hypothetical protein
VSGPQLLTPQAYVAQVSGQHALDACPETGGWGMVEEAPSFTLYMSQMDGLVFSAETTSECDPTMLIRDALGQWSFNDDGPNGLQPMLELDGATLNGRVDVWVGAFGGTPCPGTITFRTSQATVQPQPLPGGTAMGGGCPNPGMQGALVTTTGAALYSPTAYAVTAGGGQDLSLCGLPVFGAGYFAAAPGYSFQLSGMEAYGRLEIRGESSCDTVMLVRTPDGQWHFDDDSNGNLNPRVDLTGMAALNGRVDVWMGTYGGGTCAGTVTLETWN